MFIVLFRHTLNVNHFIYTSGRTRKRILPLRKISKYSFTFESNQYLSWLEEYDEAFFCHTIIKNDQRGTQKISQNMMIQKKQIMFWKQKLTLLRKMYSRTARLDKKRQDLRFCWKAITERWKLSPSQISCWHLGSFSTSLWDIHRKTTLH